jgi:hypothetical protein
MFFVTSFEALGVGGQLDDIKLIMIFIGLGAAILYLVINYLSIMNSRYEFYGDYMRLYESKTWIVKTYKDIPYKNIIKISYEYTGFMNKLLNAGEITIEVTGMKEGSVKMEVIDQTEELVAQLMKIVNEYRSLQQMQFEENRKIGNIMRRF